MWKLYTIQVFGLKLSEGVKLAPSVVAEWMAADEFKAREPVTHTARYVLAQLEKQGLLAPWKK